MRNTIAAAAILALFNTAVSALNITTYSDRNCQTLLSTIDSAALSANQSDECVALPAGAASVRSDFRDFVSGYALVHFFTASDCSGFGLGSSNGGGYAADYPVPDGTCVNAYEQFQGVGYWAAYEFNYSR